MKKKLVVAVIGLGSLLFVGCRASKEDVKSYEIKVEVTEETERLLPTIEEIENMSNDTEERLKRIEEWAETTTFNGLETKNVVNWFYDNKDNLLKDDNTMELSYLYGCILERFSKGVYYQGLGMKSKIMVSGILMGLEEKNSQTTKDLMMMVTDDIYNAVALGDK